MTTPIAYELPINQITMMSLILQLKSNVKPLEEYVLTIGSFACYGPRAWFKSRLGTRCDSFLYC